MGPFVPDPISPELNLVIALIIGIAFGFVLEQAGFSSSRKLAGVFYGYDFTVLRVFFSAAVTAMGGIMLLNFFGLLDTEAIYINPLWLWPAIVGGAIMGVGFILGGYCPGTSICAAAIGKIDALFFVGGLFIGVLFFAEMFPAWERFHESSALGPVKVYDSLGLPAGWFAFALIVVAVSAFAVTSRIEKRVNRQAPANNFRFRKHLTVAVVTIFAGAVLISLPDRKSRTIAMASSLEHLEACETSYMSSDELAFRIVDKDPSMQIVDVSDSLAYNQFSLPGSVNLQIHELFSKEWNTLFARRHVRKILVAENEQDAVIAYHVLDEIGYRNLSVLEGGLPHFRSLILNGEGAVLRQDSVNSVVREFRQEAGTAIHAMIEAQRDRPKEPDKTPRKITGGC